MLLWWILCSFACSRLVHQIDDAAAPRFEVESHTLGLEVEVGQVRITINTDDDMSLDSNRVLFLTAPEYGVRITDLYSVPLFQITVDVSERGRMYLEFLTGPLAMTIEAQTPLIHAMSVFIESMLNASFPHVSDRNQHGKIVSSSSVVDLYNAKMKDEYPSLVLVPSGIHDRISDISMQWRHRRHHLPDECPGPFHFHVQENFAVLLHDFITPVYIPFVLMQAVSDEAKGHISMAVAMKNKFSALIPVNPDIKFDVDAFGYLLAANIVDQVYRHLDMSEAERKNAFGVLAKVDLRDVLHTLGRDVRNAIRNAVPTWTAKRELVLDLLSFVDEAKQLSESQTTSIVSKIALVLEKPSGRYRNPSYTEGTDCYSDGLLTASSRFQEGALCSSSRPLPLFRIRRTTGYAMVMEVRHSIPLKRLSCRALHLFAPPDKDAIGAFLDMVRGLAALPPLYS